MNTEVDDKRIYIAVVNYEGQYSIWPEGQKIPEGWQETGKAGLKGECLAYIKDIWTDLRPSSLQQQLQDQKHKIEDESEEPNDFEGEEARGSDLVKRLSTGKHPIVVILRPNRKIIRLKEDIDHGLVHIKFTDTHGGTELGVWIEGGGADLSEANFELGGGKIRISGRLKLNYRRVKCIAEIDLTTLSGEGSLEVLDTDTERV